jgi:hypothetical protein
MGGGRSDFENSGGAEEQMQRVQVLVHLKECYIQTQELRSVARRKKQQDKDNLFTEEGRKAAAHRVSVCAVAMSFVVRILFAEEPISMFHNLDIPVPGRLQNAQENSRSRHFTLLSGNVTCWR